ncbi:hypothetical protein [Maridesulfovibrio bastinii]|jgi:hypothetical protein|uniref:hypothetical protein n=1 Tax=Maridesulfovibrio bastinii TaxID=47157 RepID=UPI000412F0C4|nr:hypothetical protein [Maridesulfovibrio bastinii]
MSEAKCECEKKTSFIGNFKLGFKIWTKQFSLILSSILGNIEVRQLEKRLEKEYALLGKLTMGNTQGDIELCKKQIEFFVDEIARLKAEQEAKRDVKNRDNAREAGI